MAFIPDVHIPDVERERAARELEASQSGSELMGLAFTKANTLGALARGVERWDEEALTPDDASFEVTNQMLEPVQHEFNDSDKSYLKGADNKVNFNKRVEWLRQDRQEKQRLREYGMTGILGMVGAALVDPTQWITGGLIGSANILRKGGTMARMAKMGAAVGAEQLAIEKVLSYGDTQKPLEDYVYAGLGSLVLGGAIGHFVKPINKGWDEAIIERVGKYRKTVSAIDDDAPLLIKAKEGEKYTVEHARGELQASMQADTARNLYAETEDVLKGVSGSYLRELVVKKATEKLGDLEKEAVAILRGRTKEQMKEEIKAIEKRIFERGVKRADPENAVDVLEVEAMRKTLKEAREVGSTISATKKLTKLLDNVDDTNTLQQIRKVLPEVAADIDDVRKLKANADKALVKMRDRVATDLDAMDYLEGVPDAVGPLSEAHIKAYKEARFNSLPVAEKMAMITEKHLENTMKTWPMRFLGPFRSLYTVLDHSDNPAFRALNQVLFPNAQGGNSFVHNVSTYSTHALTMMRSSLKNSHFEGFGQWAKENGHSYIKRLFPDPEFEREFNELVALKIWDADFKVPQVIADVADVHRESFKKAGLMRKAAGEAGWDKFKAKPSYFPKLFSHSKLAKFTTQKQQAKAKAVISKGYQEGDWKLEAELADLLADQVVTRHMDQLAGAPIQGKAAVGHSAKQKLFDALEGTEIQEEVKLLFEAEVDAAQALKNISNRAKLSAGINPFSAITDEAGVQLRVFELMDTNLPVVTDNYMREAAGAFGAGKIGFRTQDELFEAIEIGAKSGTDIGLDAKVVQAEADQLRAGVMQMYGQSIDTDPGSKAVAWSRRLREGASNAMLNQLGYVQFPEAARAIVTLGLGNMVEAMPGLSLVRRRAIRKGATSSGEYLHPGHRETELMIGYNGEDPWLTTLNLRSDDWGENVASGIERVIDKANSVGARINNVMSGFQMVQGNLEKIVARGINIKLIKHLENGAPNLSARQLDEIGWGGDFMDRLKKHFDEKPATDLWQGEEVRLMNYANMDADLQLDFAVGLRNLKQRIIQRSNTGETPLFMDKWWGKAITQFRSFSIGSIEKQLVHDLRGDKVHASFIFGWSLFLGAAAYTAKTHQNAMFREDKDEYLEKRFRLDNFGYGVFMMLPQVAGLGLGADGLATAHLLPSDWNDSDFYGPRGFSGTGLPSISYAGSIAKAGTNFMDYVKGDNIAGKTVYSSALRASPLSGIIMLNQMNNYTKANLGD